MLLNEKITELLLVFKTISALSSEIHTEPSSVRIVSCTFSEEKILINNTFNIGEKIMSNEATLHNDFPVIPKVASFLNAISSQVLGLNHIGVSYWCENIESELLEYKNAIQGSDLEIFEEPSGNPNNRWFFLRSNSDWKMPMIEIVLNQSKKYYEDIWIPHFQIDIDTSLDYKELEVLTNKYLKPNFFSWNIKIPNYGVVLGMGSLGVINNTKIYLGLGTNLRDNKRHRESLLKKVI